MLTKKEKKTEKIDVTNKIKNSSAKKNAQITAKKIGQKYKSIKKPKKNIFGKRYRKRYRKG